MPDNRILPTNVQECRRNEIFESNEDMRKSLSRLCYGDLYVIGRLWIDALKTGLVGSKWSLFPAVDAAAPPPPPQKPPPMKYKDLPIYKSPHYEYKDYIADKEKCPKANCKLIHEFLYPRVRSNRIYFYKNWRAFSKDFVDLKNEVCCAVNKKRNYYMNYVRSPENLTVRQGIVAFAGLAGYYAVASRPIPIRIFCTSFSLFLAGSLCFPKETDETFRTVAYHSGKTGLSLFNFYCKKMNALRERLPCPDEMPAHPPARRGNVCPTKK